MSRRATTAAHDHDHDHHEHDHVHGHDHDQPDHEAPEAEREAMEKALRKRVALSQIRQYGDPVLRMTAPPVETFGDELERVAERMFSLMHDSEGIGLAATQVGLLRRFFVCSLDGEDRVFVNPVIERAAGKLETESEGCLSLGPVRVDVERPIEVTVSAADAKGTRFTLELEGLEARVVQHELDHLDGKLIIDRTDEASRKEALGQLRPRLAL